MSRIPVGGARVQEPTSFAPRTPRAAEVKKYRITIARDPSRWRDFMVEALARGEVPALSIGYDETIARIRALVSMNRALTLSPQDRDSFFAWAGALAPGMTPPLREKTLLREQQSDGLLRRSVALFGSAAEITALRRAATSRRRPLNRYLTEAALQEGPIGDRWPSTRGQNRLTVALCATEEEHLRIRDRAAQAGLSLSDFLIRKALASKKPPAAR